MIVTEKIIDKLQKLIKQEQSARHIGNLAEAEAFATKIQEFLLNYQLSMSDIQIEYEAENESVDKEEIHPRDVGQQLGFGNISWQVSLLKNIALSNNCKNIVSRNSNIQYVVGMNTDRQIVIALYAYFVQLAQDICNLEFESHKLTWEYPSQESTGKKRSYTLIWKKSWLEGFADSVGNRLYLAYLKAIKEVEEDQQQGLIHLRDKEALSKKYIEDNTVSKKRSISSNKNYGAYQSGKEMGNKVSISGKNLEGQKALNAK